SLSGKTTGLDKLRLSRAQILWASTEEPTRKLKRVKRPAKKSTQAPARGDVIRETPKIPMSKKKEMVDVARGKGIELLSYVALTEGAQYEKVRKKSLRDFHKTHPSGSGIATKPTPSAAIIKPSVTIEGTGVKPGVPDVKKNHLKVKLSLGEMIKMTTIMIKTPKVKEIVKTSSNDSDYEDETKVVDKAKGDEDEEMDYTTSLLYDDVDIRMNEPVDADKGFVQEEGTDAAMTNVQQGNENPEISQVIEDAHVTLSTIPRKTEVPVSRSSHSSDLAAKFLNFSDIPTTEAEIVSPLDIPVHPEVPSQQTPTLLIVHVSVISNSSPVFSTGIPQSLQSFTPTPLLSTTTPPTTTEATNPPSTLLDFASVFQFNNRDTAFE
ncbi:hypothetical protein Tco_1459110, partial [Tanacetum coccineum]